MLLRTLIALAFLTVSIAAQEPDQSPDRAVRSGNRNDPAEVEKFRRPRLRPVYPLECRRSPRWSDLAFAGRRIAGFHQQVLRDLAGVFQPGPVRARKWAALAKLAGFEYVMFTTKHHAGFCMWDTATTDFSVMHTPYGKDVTRQLVDAFRKEGIAIGLYFSPDDFNWLHRHGIRINRSVKGVYPFEIPEFMDYTKRQLKELLTNYGPIDYFFFDGPATGLTDYAWQLAPKLVITRGAMETPEQYTPGVAAEGRLGRESDDGHGVALEAN